MITAVSCVRYALVIILKRLSGQFPPMNHWKKTSFASGCQALECVKQSSVCCSSFISKVSFFQLFLKLTFFVGFEFDMIINRIAIVCSTTSSRFGFHPLPLQLSIIIQYWFSFCFFYDFLSILTAADKQAVWWCEAFFDVTHFMAGR